MPYVNNAGVNIYYETIGEGKPLVFHHVSGGSSQDWHDLGYVVQLQK